MLSQRRIRSEEGEQCQGGFIQGQSDKSIPIIIIFLENISHPLQANATLYEEVEADGSLASFIICSEQYIHELWTESISKCYQRICVLV